MIGLGLAGEADDEIRRQHQIGPRRPQPLDQAQIVLGGMLAVHRLQDRVRARLHRQMQIGHQLGFVAMRVDQILGHVIGVARGIADAVQPVDPGQRPHQTAKAPDALRPLAVIAVDVLTQKRDFAHPLGHQLFRLRQDAGHRAREFGAARIGHDAKGAELVAALLHGQKGGGAGLHRAFGKLVELVLGGEFGVHRALAARHRGHHLGQAVVVLAAHDQIDQRHPAHDLLALGLRDTARDTDRQARFRLLEGAQPAQIGIDLFGGLFADVTGVEQHHVRLGRIIGQGIALHAHRLGHALAVIDVHLTAIGLDVQLFRRVGHGASRGWRPIPQTRRCRKFCGGTVPPERKKGPVARPPSQR